MKEMSVVRNASFQIVCVQILDSKMFDCRDTVR